MSYSPLDSWCEYKIGTAATLAFGNVPNFELGGLGQEVQHDPGIGGQDDIHWPLLKPTARVESVFKGESLLLSCTRSTVSGLPPQVILRGGILHATATLSDVFTGYVEELSLECGGVGEAVKATYDLIGLSAAPAVTTVGQAATAAATAPYVWHAGAVTINGAALVCQSFRAGVKNNLDAQSSLDLKTSGVQRVAELVEPGDEEVTATFTVKSPATQDLTRDIPTMPVTAVLKVANGYTSRVVTLNNLYLSDKPRRIAAGDRAVTWELAMQSRHNSLQSGTPAFTVAAGS
jgi:hypothetical protein